MKFLDQAKIYIKSGDGGGGAVSFHREKFIEFGGPDGGNGGRGGDVVALCADGLNTLIDFRYAQHFRAPTGVHGMGKDRAGANGEDIVLRVPKGTQIFEEDQETLIADFTEIGQRVVLLKGGNGGFGNAYFKTSANQAPRHANPGQPGMEKGIWLRLKLIADAGLVGQPNAGKSTFLAAVSAAKPKIADYPFTTLHPNLGVVRAGEREFVLADIPGLIEGASEGIGIGDRFLGHIERCGVLIHLIDGTNEDVAHVYKAVRYELAAYADVLADKPEIVVLNKIDALTPEELKTKMKALKKASKADVRAISGATGQGVDQILYDVLGIIDETRAEEAKASAPKTEEKWTPLMSANALAPYRRITIKIGSALLVDKAGKLRKAWLDDLAEDIAALKAEGRDIVVVSSGAIALGRGLLGLSAVSLTLEQSQAAASAGQISLSQAWAEALARHNIVTGQILITPNITEERRYYLNARTTVTTLLGLGAIPIFNENDSVATAEIRYGDNDRLSARVATMIEADCLVLLSDIDGLYTAPPAKDPNAQHIPVVESITPAIEAMAGGAASHLSRGGMTTKVEAGKIATLAGTAMVIAKGTETHPLKALTEGGRHTLFHPARSRAQARKRWIMGTLTVAGTLQVDAGAASALKQGRSLLPIGVTKVTGEFERGDTVAIVDPDGREIARGLVGLDSEDARLAMGKRSSTVVELLGIGSRSELIHRDNMVLTAALEELHQ